MHVQNVVLYALLCLAVARLYKRVLGTGTTATLASFLYAVDDAHLEAVAWISARNSILTALFCVLSLNAFDAAACTRNRGQAWLASMLLALAHLSSEGAVAVWAYLLGRIVSERRTFVRPATTALVLGAAVTAAFSIFTRFAHYRVVGSGAYIDARVRPAEFAAVVPERLTELMREQFGAPRWLSDWFAETALGQPLQVAAFLGMVALVPIIGPLLRRDSRLQAVGLGMLGSAIVVCGARPEPRLLLVVGVGAHALLATGLVTCWHTLARDIRGWRQLGCALAGALAVILHVIAPSLASATVPEWYRSRHRAYVKAAASMQVGPNDASKSAVILQAPSYFDALSTCMYRIEQGPISWRTLHIVGISQGRVVLRRADEETLILEPDDGYLLEKTSQQARSPDEPFVAGEAIGLDELTVVVDATTPTGRPQRLRLELGSDCENRLRFLTWKPSQKMFERIALPPIGQWIEL
jgi:hypothetical protein